MAVIPLMPAGGYSLIEKNIAEARAHGMPRNMAQPATYLWFYQKVRNKGPWDYKQHDFAMADFGNFNYGLTGLVAGIPENILHRGGGFAQWRAGTSDAVRWGYWYDMPPYGDDPNDQFWIKQGIVYAKKRGY